MNCVNKDVVGGVTSRDPIPIQNPFNTTVMPSDFRVKLFFIIVGNTIAVMAQDYFIVDGVRLATRRRKVQTAVETVSEHPIEEPKTTAENEKLAETAVGQHHRGCGGVVCVFEPNVCACMKRFYI